LLMEKKKNEPVFFGTAHALLSAVHFISYILYLIFTN
jgi:hypothetical protein